jgi:HlyD family secretion protein
MKTKLIWIGLGVALAALLVWVFMPRAVPVEVAKVSKGRFERAVEEDGKTRLRERYVVSTPLAGHVARITLKEGDSIKEGDLIATIYPTAPAFLDARSEAEMRERVGAVEAVLRRAKVGVERAKAALDQSNNELKRSESLAERGFVSPNQNETARLNVRLREKELESSRQEQDAALHELNQAQAALRQYANPNSAQINRTWQVRAPVAGRVLKVLHVSEGVTQSGTPLIELGDPGGLEVVVDVLTSDATQIRPGMVAQMSTGGGNGERMLEGRVRKIEPAAFTKVSALGVEEQRVNAVIDLSAPPQNKNAIGDGFRVNVRILVDVVDGAVMVPVSAIFPVGNRHAVFIVESGRARQKLIDVSARNGVEAHVKSGIEPDVTVIVYPATTLKEGARVVAKN